MRSLTRDIIVVSEFPYPVNFPEPQFLISAIDLVHKTSLLPKKQKIDYLLPCIIL